MNLPDNAENLDPDTMDAFDPDCLYYYTAAARYTRGTAEFREALWDIGRAFADYFLALPRWVLVAAGTLSIIAATLDVMFG